MPILYPFIEMSGAKFTSHKTIFGTSYQQPATRYRQTQLQLACVQVANSFLPFGNLATKLECLFQGKNANFSFERISSSRWFNNH